MKDEDGEDKHNLILLYIHAAFLVIIVIMFIISHWKMHITKQLMLVFLIRLYFAVFQKNEIFKHADDALYLFF